MWRPLLAARFDLVAFDLDGTLIGPDLTASEAVLQALATARSAGTAIVVATGRAHASARGLQAKLGLDGPIVCQQGAMVYGPTSEIWLCDALAVGVRNEATAYAELRGDELTMYSPDRVFMRREVRDPEFYDRWFGLERQIVADWDMAPQRPIKFLLIADDAAHGSAIEAAWRSRIDGVAVVRSHDLFVEGVPEVASKARGLAEVAKRLAVPRERILAAGDNQNDLSMIQWAGLGVAMGNAPQSVRQAADVVAPSFEEDGAAWILRRFLLEA